MVLLEYRGGKARGGICIPEARGQGWKWVADALQEVVVVVRTPNIGGALRRS